MADRILVSTRKGLFTVARTPAGRWDIARVSFLGDNVGIAATDPRDGAWYAALDHGHFGAKLHRTRDAGATWEEIGVPTYPEASEVQRDDFGREMPQKLQRIWALEPGHARESGTLWAGTIPGGLFRSADSGATWTLVRSLWDHPDRKKWFGGGADWPGIHSVCVDPRDASRVTVGVSCGGVWQTEDSGDTWNCRADGMWAAYMPPDRKSDPVIQDPHRVVQCAAAPDTLWAQHHNGVFRSTDNSRSWQELSDVPPSVFGFAVAVHPDDPQTAWFVPAVKDEKRIPVDGAVVVARTRDGGRSFDVLRDGLPQRHAYDLVFRHALDVDERGERLAFGSTTGSLWVSENGGDSWVAVSEHLPPIYAVRFAS